MEVILTKFKKYTSPLFNTRAGGIYILLFAIAIGTATFIENDFGTSAAQKVVFKTWWFEFLLFLFGVTIVVNIIKFRMLPQKRWALFTFHISIIVILIGAALTRYLGYEGIMHIRENDASNSFLTSESYLQFEVIQDGQKYQFDEPVLFASLGDNNWNESYLINNDLIDVRVKDFIPNPKQNFMDAIDGPAMIKIVFAGDNGREEYFLKQGERSRIRNVAFNFTHDYVNDAVNIKYEDGDLYLKSDRAFTQMVMATRQLDTLVPATDYYPLRLRSMYSDGTNSFVFGDFKEHGQIEIISEERKVKNESMTALSLEVQVNGAAQHALVYGKKGLPGRPVIFQFNELSLAISYGAKSRFLPFKIKLHDFIMERYPGTNSASSYASEVQLIDPAKNLNRDFRIYMNNILDYNGYRFFQSSFDKDEKGTYLSVNHDFYGTWVSYFGYFLLTVGLIFSLFSKKSRFYQVSREIKKIRAKNASLSIIFFFSLFVTIGTAQKVIAPIQPGTTIASSHAEKFSTLIVQDYKGRMKPMHTLTREFMRKIARTESLYNISADQIVLGMFINNRDWHGVPMIKVGKHPELLAKLGIENTLAAYKDFFARDGSYLLQDEVRRAYNLQPIDRGVLEKEIMKLDERVNIASMIYSGRIFKIIPVPDDPGNTWVSTVMSDHGTTDIHQPIAGKFFEAYTHGLHEALVSNDYSVPNKLIDELKDYQQVKGGSVTPSPLKIRAEILLNNLSVFGRLSALYSLLGIGFLVTLFLSVFKPGLSLSRVYKVLLAIVILGFVFHTFGLGLRWYVSGRAPWSNGYESMIYIAWTTTLAGLIFARKSIGGLAATMVLAATVLLVASLSYLDPEITPLVPVLKSYWLTIHVSLEAGSYGFLMLGAIIGLINLVLMIFLSNDNKDRIYRIVKEMSFISEMTLIGGLIMVSVGTYLGGVWANESWGRYWGWDAKETWALVTILIYAFILHMRLIPKLQGLYAYNLASLFGWASVIMTYYGVNYYLSGLHSYAAGDPVPIPDWVYMAVISVIIISLLAFWRKSRFNIF